MSVLILASVSTFLVILFTATAYIVNNGTFSKMRSDYDTKMQGIVSQMNNTEFKNYEKDKENGAVLSRNLKNINTLQEDELKMKNDLDNFKKMYSDNTTKFKTDLKTTTSNLTYLTEVVNNMPTAEQTQDILGLQSTSQDHGNRILFAESGLSSNGSSINILNNKTLAHSNAIISLSNQSKTNTIELNNLTSQNQLNINKIYLQGLSNQTLSQNASNLEGNFKAYSYDTTNWMNYAHSNLYSNVMPTLDTINQNYVKQANYNTFSNSVSQNLSSINNTLTNIPNKYATSNDLSSLNTRTKDVEILANTLNGQYSAIKGTYATIDDLLKIKVTAGNNSNTDAIFNSTLARLTGAVSGLYAVDDALRKDINKTTLDITGIRGQYTELDSAYKSIITKDGVGARTFRFDANDPSKSKPAFQIVNGSAVLLDINANGTATLNNLNLNTTGATNFSGTTTINNQTPATQPWVNNLLNGDISAANLKSRGNMQVDGGLNANGAIEGNWLHSKSDMQIDRNAQINGGLNANGDISASNFKIGSRFTAKVDTLSNTGRQHVYSGELLYLLPKSGVEVGKEWGGNGNLNAQGDISACNIQVDGSLSAANLTGRNGDLYLNKLELHTAGDNGWWNNITQKGDKVITNVTEDLEGKSINRNGITFAPWNSAGGMRVHGAGVDIKGTLGVNDNKILLRNDYNHYLSFEGGSIDGPVLKGYTGGVLGTTGGAPKVLEWNKDGVKINGNLTLNDQQVATNNYVDSKVSSGSGNTSDTINNIKFSSKWLGYPDNATNQSEISNDTSNFKKLMIVGNRSQGDGIRRVGIWDQLDVNGTLQVNGNLKICDGNGSNCRYL